MEQLELEKQIKRIILAGLKDTIPIPVRVSFDDEGGRLVVSVWWPEYRLSWMGRPEQHKLRAVALVETAFHEHWYTRLLGLAVLPFISRRISSDPIVLLPRTEVVYKGRGMNLLIADTSDTGFVIELVTLWAEELRRKALEDRGALPI